MLTFILTLPTPPTSYTPTSSSTAFQVPSWCCALVHIRCARSRWRDGPAPATALGLDAMCGTAPVSLGHPAEGTELCLVAPRRSLPVMWLWPRADEAMCHVVSHLCIVAVLVPWEHSWDRMLMGVIALDLCHILTGNYPDYSIPETNLLQERKDIVSLPSVQLQWESGFIFWK